MIRKNKFSITDLSTIATRLEKVRKKLKSPQAEKFQIDLELITVINKLKAAISSKEVKPGKIILWSQHNPIKD